MTIEVHAERPYEVHVAPGCRAELPALAAGATRVAVVHPQAIAQIAHEIGDTLEAEVTYLPVPDGEQAKTVEVLATCWATLAENRFTRSDMVVGVGGGATTDLAGFVAASWLRGVGYVSVPTTVLAMVDAAVGGKTGINLAAGKNLVGAFHEPRGVLCDLDLLTGLPAAEVASGMAEVAKAGFIADEAITEIIGRHPAAVLDVTTPETAEVIARSIQMKADVVSTDLRERTSAGAEIGREALNYGHTLGHAIEKLEHFRWRHGEAISVGMVFAAELAHRLDFLTADEVRLHRDQLASLGLPISYTGDWEALRATMSLDKKTRGSVLRFVLLDGLRHPVVVDGPDEAALRDAYAAVWAEAVR